MGVFNDTVDPEWADDTGSNDSGSSTSSTSDDSLSGGSGTTYTEDPDGSGSGIAYSEDEAERLMAKWNNTEPGEIEAFPDSDDTSSSSSGSGGVFDTDSSSSTSSSSSSDDGIDAASYDEEPGDADLTEDALSSDPPEQSLEEAASTTSSSSSSDSPDIGDDVNAGGWDPSNEPGYDGDASSNTPNEPNSDTNSGSSNSDSNDMSTTETDWYDDANNPNTTEDDPVWMGDGNNSLDELNDTGTTQAADDLTGNNWWGDTNEDEQARDRFWENWTATGDGGVERESGSSSSDSTAPTPSMPEGLQTLLDQQSQTIANLQSQLGQMGSILPQLGNSDSGGSAGIPTRVVAVVVALIAAVSLLAGVSADA